MTKETIQDYIKQIKSPLFAKCEDINTAAERAYNMLKALDGADRCIAMTALHMCLNTVASDIEVILNDC
jgi:hypothetical protein